MAQTIFDPTARQALLARLDTLQPTTTPQWGKFTAPRMIAHLIDAVRMGLGEVPVKVHVHPARLPLLRTAIIRWLPWPKGAPTAPELLKRVPENWSADVATLRSLLERAGANATGYWQPHPLFGGLSNADWGCLVHRHVAHHLTQFGV